MFPEIGDSRSPQGIWLGYRSKFNPYLTFKKSFGPCLFEKSLHPLFCSEKKSLVPLFFHEKSSTLFLVEKKFAPLYFSEKKTLAPIILFYILFSFKTPMNTPETLTSLTEHRKLHVRCCSGLVLCRFKI